MYGEFGLKLVKRDDPCNKCGKNKWMEETLRVNGREEKRYTCVFCATINERVVHSLNKEGNTSSRKIIMRNHTEKNLESD